MTGEERDPILERLREIDPAREEPSDEQLVRANVKHRVESAIDGPRRRRSTRRTGLLIAGAGGLAAVLMITLGGGGGDGLAPGPERALAIEKSPDRVTLTIEDAGASAEEMNRELGAAGVEGVRVFSLPGSPDHAGTWAGFINIAVLVEHALAQHAGLAAVGQQAAARAAAQLLQRQALGAQAVEVALRARSAGTGRWPWPGAGGSRACRGPAPPAPPRARP